MKKTTFRGFALAASMSVFTAHAQSGLTKGGAAPFFKSKDNNGNTIDLKQLLKSHTSVVLFFYRGQWCPYCNKYMMQIQDSLQMLTDKGAYVIGVTPETSGNISRTIEKTHASFSIVRDADYRIMTDYDVLYTVDETTAGKLMGYGISLEKSNGNSDRKLPVPATYVIGKSGKIRYVHFDRDYTHRPSVKAILEQI